MGLKAQLAELREASAKRIPADKLAVMHAATNDLRGSGILERMIKVGDTLPAFDLENARGERVRSQDLLARGAVVLTVFRGHW